MEKFVIQNNEYWLTLSNKKHLYSEDYDGLCIATNAYGVYIPNIIHNYRTGIYYNVYIESGTPFICLAKFITQKLVVNRRLQYISFSLGKKVGIIRHGMVEIEPKYTSIFGYKLIVDGKYYEDYREEYKVLFVVSLKGKKGLYLEDKEILPTEYDSIFVEEESGGCTLIKDNRYFIGNFKGYDAKFSMTEISEDEFMALEEEENDCNTGYEWTDEDTWIALTDGQYGQYPNSKIDWDTLDDMQGR